jgi:hypothetical protein
MASKLTEADRNHNRDRQHNRSIIEQFRIWRRRWRRTVVKVVTSVFYGGFDRSFQIGFRSLIDP